MWSKYNIFKVNEEIKSAQKNKEDKELMEIPELKVQYMKKDTLNGLIAK